MGQKPQDCAENITVHAARQRVRVNEFARTVGSYFTISQSRSAGPPRESKLVNRNVRIRMEACPAGWSVTPGILHLANLHLWKGRKITPFWVE